MHLNRRRALQAGATIMLSAGVAGCLGNGDNDEDDRDDRNGQNDRQNGGLGIEHVRLLAEQPTDYQEYEEVDDGQYSGDSVVWFYFEPVGVTTEDAGAGQDRIALRSSLTVTHRDETVATVEEEFHRDIPEGGTDELYLFFQFTPPITPAPPGRYEAELSLTDERADTTVTETARFTIEEDQQLHDPEIQHIRFVEAEPAGYREYTPVDDPVYGPDEDIWIYFEPTGLAVEQRDDERWAAFTASATLTDPDGSDVGRVSDDLTVSIPEGDEELFVYFELGLREPRVGEYTVELNVLDRLTRNDATETTAFTIADEALARVEIFREVLEDETDIEIQSVGLHDEGELLRLRYDSAYAYEESPEGFGGELGYISGAYAGLLDETFMPTRLLAGGEDQSGTEFSYRVQTDLAVEYLDDELSEEEFIDQVFETLQFDGEDSTAAPERP